MNISIIGTGAVGTGIAVLLKQKLQLDATLIARSGTVNKEIHCNIFGSAPLKLQLGAVNTGEADLIFLCVKSYDLRAAILQQIPQFDSSSIVISLTNGYMVDVIKQCSLDFPQHQWRMGVTNFGFKRSKNKLAITNPNGSITWGGIDSQMESSDWEQQLMAADCFRWSTNPEYLIRKKWLMNVVINGLCAHLELSTNGLLQNYKNETCEIFTEAYSFGQKHWGEWPDSAELLMHQIEALIDDTRDNENSMVADLRKNGRTEMGHLAGLCQTNGEFPWLEKLREI